MDILLSPHSQAGSDVVSLSPIPLIGETRCGKNPNTVNLCKVFQAASQPFTGTPAVIFG
jgi:hypothetical protein